MMNTAPPLSELTPEATISQIRASDERAADLLASIGLPLENHEEETLRAVCRERHWSEAEVLEWIKRHAPDEEDDTAGEAEPEPGKSASLEEWAEYLDHEFIAPNLSLLEELNESFPRVLKIHGNQYTWLKQMKWHYNTFGEALRMYCSFERNRFFPLTRRLKTDSRANINHGTVRDLNKSFEVMEKDRDRLSELMDNIRSRGNDFKNPGIACSTLRIQNKNFKILFSRLETQFKVESERFLPQVKEEMKATV